MVHARSGYRCEAKIPGAGCSGDLEHRHHRRFRSGGEDHSVQNVLGVCTRCHEWIHRHKRTAMEFGWAISSHSSTDPAEVPVSYLGRMGLLHPTGRVEFLLMEVPSL